MNSTGLYIAGGLLAGAGKAITDSAEQRRQDALIALKREYEVEDTATKAANDLALKRVEGENQLATVKATGAENRKTEAVKGVVDQQNIILRGTIDLNNSKVIENLKSRNHINEDTIKAAQDLQNQLKLAGVTVDHWDVTSDGRIVAFNKQGGVLRYSANPGSFTPKNGDDGLGGGIAGLRGDGSSPAPAPAAPKKQASPGTGKVKAEAKAQLGNLYAEISAHPEKLSDYQQRFPAMFDAAGNLLPKDQLLARVDQRYGG